MKFDIDDDAEFTSTVTSDINAMAADPDDMDEFSLSQFTKVQQDGVDDNFHLITQIKTPLDLMNDDVKPCKYELTYSETHVKSLLFCTLKFLIVNFYG